MPSDKPSEEITNLLIRATAVGMGDAEFASEALRLLAEAARLLAPFEQPEVAELLVRADELGQGCPEIVDNAEAQAADLRAWAAAMVALAEAQAKLARVEALLEKHAVVFGDELEAALASGEKEVPSEGH